MANRDIYESVLERMHWHCFHLEFEHPGDPDLPCEDPSCHEWQLALFEKALRELGHDPGDFITAALKTKEEVDDP